MITYRTYSFAVSVLEFEWRVSDIIWRYSLSSSVSFQWEGDPCSSSMISSRLMKNLVRVLPLIQTWSSPKSLRQESFIFSLSEEGWEGRTEIQSSHYTSIISSQILISELRRMICISNTLVYFWLSKFAVSSLINSLSMFTWRTTSLLCEGVRRRAFCFSSIPKICSESVQVDIIFRFDESFEETDWIFESSPPCP